MSTVNITPRNTIESKLDFLAHTYPNESLDFVHLPTDASYARGISQDDPYPYIDHMYRKAVEDVENNKAMYLDVPDVTAIGYSPLQLHTYYPTLSGNYPIGHSAITVSSNPSLWVDTIMSDNGYNILTNNCSDDTGKCLEQVFEKKMNVFGFTTPGDVLDFAKDNGAYTRGTSVYIPMNKERWKRFKNYVNNYKERILNK